MDYAKKTILFKILIRTGLISAIVAIISFTIVYKFATQQIREYKRSEIESLSKIMQQIMQLTEEDSQNFKLNHHTINIIEKIKQESKDFEEISIIDASVNEVEENFENEIIITQLTNKKQKSNTQIMEAEDGEYIKYYIPLSDNKILKATVNMKDEKLVEKQLFFIFLSIFLLSIVITIIFSKYINQKNWKILIAEKERLKIAEDFKSIVEILPNAIYKFKKENNHIYFLYNEGITMEEFNLTTNKVKNKRIEDVFFNEISKVFSENLNKAFNGEEVHFNIEMNNRLLHHIAKPIRNEDNSIIEVAGYATDITEQVKTEERIRSLAYYDQLTNLPNRLLFNEKLKETIENLNKEDILTIMLLDLDNFKYINDTLGHIIGDKVIIEVSNRLRKCLNKDNEFIARISGDEFIIVLPKTENTDYIDKVTQCIMNNFRIPFSIEGHQIFITTSIGISYRTRPNIIQKMILKEADMALNAAKMKGKNNFQFYNEEMLQKAQEKVELISDLRKAIKEKQFNLYYQPQIELDTGKLIGVEALIRWNHPTKGFVSPASFIPIAEETGLIEEIGEWTLYEACYQFKKWVNRGYEPINMSVNLSARQFKQENLAELIYKVIRVTDMDPNYLNLEITETTSMKDIDFTIKTVNEIKKLGIQFSIDDFGTGYSSLSYLKKLPISKIKIDRSFVNDINIDKNGEEVIKSIIDLGKRLNIKLVAEGVEKDNQRHFLKSLECNEYQGYLFSPPVPSDKLEIFLNKMK